MNKDDSSPMPTEDNQLDALEPEQTLAENPAENPAEDLDEDLEADLDADLDDEAAPEPPDPIVGVLLRIALALIVVVLVTAALMLLTVRGRNNAPRSVAERDISTWETATTERPSDSNAWARLSSAYADAKRYDDAISTARRGRAITGEDVLWLVEADALRASGKYEQAVQAYTQAEKAITADQKVVSSGLKKKDIYVAFPSDAIGLARYGRALSEYALGDLRAASRDMSMAVDVAPDQAYMSVALGDYRLKAGDRVGAAAAYKAALKYVPDYKEALDGLKKAEGR
jgi:tetratricopeptide (TPR) repeat protein